MDSVKTGPQLITHTFTTHIPKDATDTMPSVNKLHTKFLERFKILLGDEFEAFLQCLNQPPVSFLRVNTLKFPVSQGKKRLAAMGVETHPLPWYHAGFRVSGEYEKISHSREFALGYFYFQEGGSTIPPLVLNLQEKQRILDVCAAPGSKTTQMAQIIQNSGVIVANERIFRRVASLGHNLRLCGIANTIVLCEDGRKLPQKLPITFDRILVDVPCTASGHLRSKAPQYDIPDQKRIRGIQTLQKELLSAGFRMLKSGGLLVYSTCSLHPEENEDVVQNLVTQFPDAELVQPNIPQLVSHTGISSWENRQYVDSMHRCLRVYPHDNDTDGFFIALIRRSSS
ncbi:MAG: RsmB/NOP family class I SAM-dependent RNA methyltransferase [Promethearchaeota archaeon]